MSSDLLARVNFPLYSAAMLTSRHMLVAGGGGASKTGIRNGVKIFELSNDGQHTVAELMSTYETADKPVMNCAVAEVKEGYILAVGADERLQLYSVQLKKVTEAELLDSALGPEGVRRRKHSECKGDGPDNRRKLSDANSNDIVENLTFDIKPYKSVQTDFTTKEPPLQKVVRISPDRSIIVTGGLDGKVRVWKFPTLEKLHEIDAHGADVDDIDISPSGNKIASVSRDGSGYVWSGKDGKRLFHLKLQAHDDKQKYGYKRCRFATIEGNRNNYCLFTAVNPIANTKKDSYIIKWNGGNFTIGHQVAVSEVISALATSDNGVFVAIGLMFSGAVEMYIGFSLTRVMRIEGAHRSFVTGLEFLPSGECQESLSGQMEASVTSISVDNHLMIHHFKGQRTVEISRLVFMLVALFLVICVMLFLSWINV